MTKCDYKSCKEEGASVCMIVDIAGEVYHQCFCIKHLKNMLHGEAAIYDD